METNEPNDERSEEKGLVRISYLQSTIAAVVTGAACLLIGAYVARFGIAPSDKQEVWGQFGDFVGGVMNPLIGCFTLALLVFALHLQNELLRETRKQLEISKEELKKSTKELSAQSAALQKQSTDAWFFQLMVFRTQMLPRVEHKYGNMRAALKKFIDGHVVQYLRGDHPHTTLVNGLAAEYVLFLRQHEDVLLPLIRLDSEILLQSSRLQNEKDANQNRRLLASQMTSSELLMVLFYGLCCNDNERSIAIKEGLLLDMEMAIQTIVGQGGSSSEMQTIRAELQRFYQMNVPATA